MSFGAAAARSAVPLLRQLRVSTFSRATPPLLRSSNTMMNLTVSTTMQDSAHPYASQPHATRPRRHSSVESLTRTATTDSDDMPLTPATTLSQLDDATADHIKSLTQHDAVVAPIKLLDEVLDSIAPLSAENDTPTARGTKRRATSLLAAQTVDDIRRIMGDGGETGTQLIEKYCCGGGCCMIQKPSTDLANASDFLAITLPDTHAFRSLELKLGPLSLTTELTQTAPLPPQTVIFEGPVLGEPKPEPVVTRHPPEYMHPHHPYNVFSAPLHHARELTKPGALKRTFHFDIDITDYPEEGGIDFKVGGAIGVCPPNPTMMVDDVFDRLGVPNRLRDRPMKMRTISGRWPTVWDDDRPRALVTTRRELLTWCSDIQSTSPTKPLLRLLAESAHAPNEKKILLYLASAQGQAAFCEMRTGPHLTLSQLLHAFPSCQPPLDHLLSVLPQLMPRFYSLSNDPHISSARDGLAGRRLIEMAVTVHETGNWQPELPMRTGVGSGFLERLAKQFIDGEQRLGSASAARTQLDLRVPMFRGLMANPLSKEFASEGPMLLIGAGVGMAPFRGFILNRLKNANCANKIWLIQGVRDSSFDELYQGELGEHERSVKRVVQSRAGPVTQTVVADPAVPSAPTTPGLSPKMSPVDILSAAQQHTKATPRYVQDEVRNQADVVWYVINSRDGRVFVCGSSQGMGEGVERALFDVAMQKGGLCEEEAREFWQSKKEGGQFVMETW